VAETAAKPLSAPLQKHSTGGCAIDMPLPNCRQREWHIVSPRDTLFYLFKDDNCWTPTVMRV